MMMVSENNCAQLGKKSIINAARWRKITGAIIVGVVATYVAKYLGYLPNVFRNPEILVSMKLSTDNDIVDSAFDIMHRDPSHIMSRRDKLEKLDLVIEKDLVDRIASYAETDPDFWDNVQNRLLARRIIPSVLEEYLAEAIRWRDVTVPIDLLPRGHQGKEIGGPVTTAIIGHDVPSGSIFVADLKNDFDYLFLNAYVYPSVLGRGIRLSYYNSRRGEQVDVFAVENNDRFDPNALPRNYNSEDYDYVITPSDDFIFLTIGDEKQEILRAIAATMSLKNSLHKFENETVSGG